MLPKIRSRWFPGLVLSALVLAFAVNGRAQDDWNKRTLVTVNRPIEVSGTVIPPGKYMFEILSLQGERNVVRISEQKTGKIFRTVIAVPTTRFEAKGETTFLYYEAPKGSPEPLRAWFYPDHTRGVEFVYPKKRAVEIAAASSEYVMAEKTPPPSEPTVQQLLEEPVVAVSPRGAEVEVAQAPAPKVAAQPEPAPATFEAAPPPPPPLPKTGSELPLVGLIGILAAAAASTIRLYRR